MLTSKYHIQPSCNLLDRVCSHRSTYLIHFFHLYAKRVFHILYRYVEERLQCMSCQIQTTFSEIILNTTNVKLYCSLLYFILNVQNVNANVMRFFWRCHRNVSRTDKICRFQIVQHYIV